MNGSSWEGIGGTFSVLLCSAIVDAVAAASSFFSSLFNLLELLVAAVVVLTLDLFNGLFFGEVCVGSGVGSTCVICVGATFSFSSSLLSGALV